MNLKHAVSAGIGLFIAFIGLQNAKIVVESATLVSVFSFKGSLEAVSYTHLIMVIVHLQGSGDEIFHCFVILYNQDGWLIHVRIPPWLVM